MSLARTSLHFISAACLLFATAGSSIGAPIVAVDAAEGDDLFSGFHITRAPAVIDAQEVLVYRLFARFNETLACDGVKQFRIVSGSPVFFHKDFASDLEFSTKAGSWSPQHLPASSAATDSYLAIGTGVGPSQGPTMSYEGFADSSPVVAQPPLPSVTAFVSWTRQQGPLVLGDAEGLVLLGQFVVAPDTVFRAAVTVAFRYPTAFPEQFVAFGEAVFSPSDYDECPDDPDKVFEGLCGCGVPETDADADLQPDCVDRPFDFVPTLQWAALEEPDFRPRIKFGKIERRSDLLAVGTVESWMVRLIDGVPTPIWTGGVLLAERSTDSWAPSEMLFDPAPPSGNTPRLGWSVAIGRRSDGSEIVVAGGYAYAPSDQPAPTADPSVVIWSRADSGSEWVLEERLAPPAPPTGTLPRFGSTVATTGDRIAVAEPRRSNGTGMPVGRVYIYRFDGGAWIRTAEILRPAESATGSDHFLDLVFDGDRLLVGDRFGRADGSSVVSGRVHIYELSSVDPKTGAENWEFVASLADPRPTPFAGGFGCSLSLSGDRLAVGSDRGPNPALADHGSVHLFRRDADSPSGWTHETEIQPIGFEPHYQVVGEARFGGHVDLAGDLLVIQGGAEHFATEIGASIYRRAGGAEWVPVGRAERTGTFFSSATLVDGRLARANPWTPNCGLCTSGRVEFAELGLRDCDGDRVDDPDTDGDGIADCIDPDANGSGRDDIEEPAGDLDGDGTVGAADLAILIRNWGANGLGDLDGDGIVGPRDLAALLSLR